ncbi:MAG TPA: patatin-like phospholipase family protein [Anaerolineales bacterium]|nr:patatin-like phospholipase family protein [Anaerolineales bacterium]
MDIALALGGGGAKGNAHIGVLRVLEREGFRVRAVAGTSFGGIVACFYAAGFTPDEIQHFFEDVDQSRLYGRDNSERPALLGLSRVRQWLKRTIGDRTFKEARIPCAVTAVDIRTSREIIISDGLLRHAILCTIALPGIFPSFLREEEELVDGGLVNPVPVSVARALRPGLPVVAVTLTGRMGRPPRSVPLPFMSNLPGPLADRVGQLRLTQAMDTFLRSIDIGGRQIAELRFQLEKPDVIIRPDVEEIGVLDRVDVAEAAAMGEKAAVDALPALRRAVSWTARMRRLTSKRPS